VFTDPTTASAGELAAAIRAHTVSAVEVLDAYLAQIDRWNPTLNAIVTLDADGARRRAVAADVALAHGVWWGPLHGVPVTLKDGHSTAGLRTTAGYPPLADYIPAQDGTVAARLRAAGAVLLGKTNVPPLLLDIQTDNALFGRTNNPWNPARTPGGSSGGAAAALAAGMTALDVGSDFAGSIRIPAHFCGLFGLKPTEGRVPLTGHIADLPGAPVAPRLLWSIGPLARSVADLDLALRVLAGPDGRDTDVPPVPVEDPPLLALRDLRIAWTPGLPGLPVAAAIQAALHDLATRLAGAGARVAATLPAADLAAQGRLRTDLAKLLLTAFDPPGARPAPTLAAYFTALHARDAAITAWEAFFTAWDVLLCPVTLVTAFPHAPPGSAVLVDGILAPGWQLLAHCALFNLTGQPVVVIPVGVDPAGLPIGIQIVARRWGEARLLAIAAAISAVVEPLGRPPPPPPNPLR